MKKNKRLELLLTFLWTEITLLGYKDWIAPALDALFAKIIGKTFSQRSVLLQVLFLTAAALILAIALRRALSHRKVSTGTVIGCLTLTTVLLGLICALQTIRRDDYWEIHDAVLYGFPGFIRIEYVGVNGRYFSLFLKSLYKFLSPTVYINTLLVLNILLLMGGAVYGMRLIDRAASRRIRITGGISLSLGLLFISPNIWEVWFWGGGTLIYGIGITAALWSAVLMLDIAFSQPRSRKKMAAAAFCIFCACGTSELITASICWFSFMIFLLPGLIGKRRLNRQNAFLTLFAWAITGFILLTSGDIKGASGMSGQQIGGASAMILTIPEKVLTTVHILLTFAYSRIEYVLVFAALAFLTGLCCSVKISGKGLWSAVIVLCLGAVGSLLINVLIDFVVARAISVSLSWGYLGLVLIMLKAGSWVRERIWPDTEMRMLPALISLALLSAVGLFYAGNIGKVRDIRTAWIARDQQLSALQSPDKPVETCAIPVMGSGRADPGEDPLQNFNIVTAYYYGFPAVTADHLCPPFGP